MAQSGLDWIIVDLEHGPIDLGMAHAMIVATALLLTLGFDWSLFQRGMTAAFAGIARPT